MGKPVLITSFVDDNLIADLTTGISQTVIIHLLNKSPIEWYYKPQSCVKTATYGSEYAAACMCTDQIVHLCNTLIYLDVTLQMVNGTDASFMFGDNFSVVNSTVMPAGKLQCNSHIFNCHRTRQAQQMTSSSLCT